MTVLASSVAHGGADYQISRSLRFNSTDSASLTRTPGSAGDRRKWTWSGWVKTLLDGTNRVFLSGTGGGATTTWFRFNSSDQIDFVNYDGSTFLANLQTNAVFRDPGAWYHIVGAFDSANATAADRLKVYVNGVLQTMTNTGVTQNSDSYINTTGAQYIGREARSVTYLFNGYMADVYLIDGQALTASSFGRTDPLTGVWSPIAYGGSYGTNGFSLKFADNSNTTATTLGKDSSSNGNNWTPTNFSVTAGFENDSLIDSPTNYGIDTGVGGQVRGNYCIWNTADGNGSRVRNGGLGNVGGGDAPVRGTIAVSSGKWYWEVNIPSGNAPQNHHGIWSIYENPASYTGATAGSWGMFDANGNKRNNGSYVAYGTGFAATDVVMTALDMDSGKIWWGKNGTWFNSGSPTAGTNAAFTNILSVTNTVAPAHNQYEPEHYNFGQRPFAYTAPSGFKCLCSTNLPSTIGATAATQASKYFNTSLWSGNGTSQTITGVGFQPNFTWFKRRSTSGDHALYDTPRGGNKSLGTNTSLAEVTELFTIGFNSDGYSIPTGDNQVNGSGITYVGLSWKGGGANVTNTSGTIQSSVSASTDSGFSVVTWTGNGSNSDQTVGTGLSTALDFVITKPRDSGAGTDNWLVYTSAITLNQNECLVLNSTSAKLTNADQGTPSRGATAGLLLLRAGTGAGVNNQNLNKNNIRYVAYCFHQIEGFSKFGSYIGNSSTDGPFVYLGFRPRFVIMKVATNTGAWAMYDSSRDSFNYSYRLLFPNLSNAETSDSVSYRLDFLSNGFKIRAAPSDELNQSHTYIYAAFAESPFKYSRAR